MTAPPQVRREFRRGQAPPANFDEWEAWIDSDGSALWFDADPPRVNVQLVVTQTHLAARVDVVAGEFFRCKWRQRLADAEGDYGHVARQMRKAGVPLDLALAILLMPEELLPAEPRRVANGTHALTLRVATPVSVGAGSHSALHERQSRDIQTGLAHA